MTPVRHHVPLTLITALLVLLVAALAGGTLWLLRRVHGQSAHATATRTMIERGRLIAAYLADDPTLREATDTPDWQNASRLVRSLYTLENGLDSVSVIRDGEVLFHESTSALDALRGPADGAPQAPSPERVRLDRKLVRAGDAVLPVVVFAVEVPGKDGRPMQIEVALKRDVVGREEQAAAGAIGSMFKLSLVTVVVSFAVCVLLVVWMMRREVQREKLRREQEHLAFSGGLANGIVHDFRNPMSSMRLDVQMLEKEAARGPECRMARVAELVIRIRETLDRMDKVFREFLYLAKPVSDLAERMDLGVCIRDCLDLLAPRFDQAGVRVEAELPGPGALEVVAHEVALRRAFVNVLMNAEQFSTRGSVVRVRAGVEDGAAVLDVLDSGPGISRLARKRIFEMFFSTRPGGTGLGLFLARAAVERSGGTIEAWNRPEGGACFRIRLPRAEPPPAAAGTMTS